MFISVILVCSTIWQISTPQRVMAGTIPYKAPEMIRAHKRSTLADIYSVGCVCVELFTEKHVWGDLDGTEITGKVLEIHDESPQQPSCLHMPEQVQDICLICTRIIPAERPSAANFFIATSVINVTVTTFNATYNPVV